MFKYVHNMTIDDNTYYPKAIKQICDSLYNNHKTLTDQCFFKIVVK